eukprot:1250408-Rhodomonas_salina.1
MYPDVDPAPHDALAHGGLWAELGQSLSRGMSETLRGCASGAGRVMSKELPAFRGAPTRTPKPARS